MSFVARISGIPSSLVDIFLVCCSTKARKLLDNPDVVAKLSGDVHLLEHSVLPVDAPKLAGQPPVDTLTRGT